MAMPRPARAALRLLLLGSIAWAAWSYWLGPTLQAGKGEQKAVAGIDGVAGTDVLWSGHVRGVRLQGVGPEQVEALRDLKLSRLQILQLTACQLVDADLALLAGFPDVVELDLRDTPVTDEGLKHLLDLPLLEKVNLGGTQVSFEGRKNLEKERPNLRFSL